MRTPGSVSVVIPAYNEARRLGATLTSIVEYLHANTFARYEVIVVDDGSSDATASIARAFARRHNTGNVRVLRAQKNLGKGAALSRGIVACQGDLVLCTDADLSTPIEELDKLLRPIRAGADIAIGSRSARGSIVLNKPWYRKLLSAASSAVIRHTLRLPYRDTQCGFKLYRHEAALALFKDLTLPRFSYDIEVLSRAHTRGLRVAEVGVRWEHRELTTVRARDIMQSLVDIFRVRFGLTERAPLMQLVRFMAVGVVNTLIDTGVYITLTRLTASFSSDIVAAKFFSFLAATISSFYLNRYWTFGIRTPLTLRELWRFYLTVSASMALNVALMFVLVHAVGIYDLVALALVTIMTFGLNYALSRLWVFRTPSPPSFGRSPISD